MGDLVRIRRTIAGLKRPGGAGSSLRLPAGGGGRAAVLLRPIPAGATGAPSADARLLAEWRNRRRTAFFTWIAATPASTAAWLADRYGPNDEDVMFFVETPAGEPFGHVALCRFEDGGAACEFGRVLRGTDAGPPGGMTLGALALLRWAATELGVERFFLEVFADNRAAIALYERLGFRRAAALPLARTERDGVVRWEKLGDAAAGGAPEAYALRMEAPAAGLPGG